jgi:hypothetical protein
MIVFSRMSGFFLKLCYAFKMSALPIFCRKVIFFFFVVVPKFQNKEKGEKFGLERVKQTVFRGPASSAASGEVRCSRKEAAKRKSSKFAK